MQDLSKAHFRRLANTQLEQGEPEIAAAVFELGGVVSKGGSAVTAASDTFLIDDEHRARCVLYATLLLGLPAHLRLPYPILRRIAMQAATD